MEAGKASNFVINGGLRMPIGYRFHPTDLELVVHYLKRKALGLPLPAYVIPHLDIFQTDPWTFTGDLKEKRYFFFGSERSKKRSFRADGSGYWKPTGKQRPIFATGTNQLVGIRTTFVFSKKKHSLNSNTRWVMHRFCLADSLSSSHMCKGPMPVEWFVCRVFMKKRRLQRRRAMAGDQAAETFSVMDLRVEEHSGYGPPEPSSPSSIGISSDYEFDFEQTTCITSYSSNDCIREK